MPTPYVSEVKIFSFGFAPKGWLPCDGRLLSINENPVLFSLLGTAYGGNGTNNFALPNLQGAVPLHVSIEMPRGQTGGERTHTLIINEIPKHTHQAVASMNVPDIDSPDNNYWPTDRANTPYGSETNGHMNQGAVGFTGQGFPHENMAPYLGLNICIAVTGIYPT